MPTICDKAEELWDVFLKTKDEKDRQKYINHVLNCPEDFVDLKNLHLPECDIKMHEKGYTHIEIAEIVSKLKEIGINCTPETAECDYCDHEVECHTVFLKFDKDRSH